MSAHSSWRTCGSRPTVGSSSSSSRGRCTSARAMSSRRRMPPDSSSTFVSRRSPRFATATARSTAARRSPRGTRYRCANTRRFCSTVSVMSRLSSCGTTPHSARATFDCPGSVYPSTSISPSSAIACAVSIRIVVLLPAPLGPSRPTHVPTGTSRSRPATAVIGPKRFTTPRRRMARSLTPSQYSREARAETGGSRTVVRLPSDAPMAHQYIFQMHRLTKAYPPDRTVVKDLTLAFYPGAKIGVLGYNGAGKSTVLNIMAGRDADYRGDAMLAPDAKVGLLEQEPHLDPAKDVRGNVEDGVAETRALLDRFNELAANYSDETADEFARLQTQIDAADAWNLDTNVEYAMDALRLPPADADVTNLSGGERRRVALCRLLLAAPDLLLLDEPTNHLDAESVAWLERHLAEYKGTIVAVTHDRYFLDNVAGWILELDRGHGIPFQGNYSSWLEQKQARLAVEEKQESARRRTPARELEWVRMAPRARHAKSKARLDAYEKLLAEEQSVRLDSVEIHIPAGPRLGTKVVEAEHVRKGFGDRLLFDDLSFNLPPGGIVGVIGANGAGKTTLFRMIAGQESPDTGDLELGESVQVAYVDQSRAELDPANTVWKEISGGRDTIQLGKREVNSRAYCSWFNFRGSDQQKPVGQLSGGERNRVHLAKLLKSGGNLLLLDEPTNDLDVDTLRALEEALLDFAGCAVVISHDRWFLDRVATHILAFEGDSQVTWFEGSWEEYAAWVKETRGPEALEPHRIKYKPLARPV